MCNKFILLCFRNLPRAIWIAMPMVTIIYVMANLAYFAVVTKLEMMSNPAVAAVSLIFIIFGLTINIVCVLVNTLISDTTQFE